MNMIGERLTARSEKGVEKDLKGILCVKAGDQNRCPVEEGLRDGVKMVGSSRCTGEARGGKISKDFEDDFIREVAGEGHDEREWIEVLKEERVVEEREGDGGSLWVLSKRIQAPSH